MGYTANADIEQELADHWAEAAQRYVGYWHGVVVHGRSLSDKVTVTDEPWEEPLDQTDDCAYCQRMTDEDIERRILGFQHAMDEEVRRVNATQFMDYDHEYPHPESWSDMDFETYRRYLKDVEGAKTLHWFSYDFTELPYRLKRRLCVDWNHLLLDWLTAHPEMGYDLDAHKIVRVTSVEKAVEEELAAEDRAYAATPFGGSTEELADDVGAMW